MKRRVMLVAATVFAQGVEAQEFASPEDLLSTLYQAYLSAPITNVEPYFSARLTEEMQGGQLGREALQRLGFDPFFGTDRPEVVTTFHLETSEATGPTATSLVSFRSSGEQVTINFELVQEPEHGWQIDHLSGKAGDLSWCSNDLVAAMQTAAN